MTRFNVGDIVNLITGSGPMTVISVFGTRLVECEWVGKEGRIYKNHFRPDSLELCEDIEEKQALTKNLLSGKNLGK